MSEYLSRTLVSDYVKEYPDMIKIYIYHNDYIQTNNPSIKRNITKEQKNEQVIHRSVRRTRSTISDIILCNRFDLWCTFTFDKLKHNRYDINHCKTTMSLWLERQKARSNDFAYLIVPELHNDGALHFHALLRGYSGTMRPTKQRTKANNLVVNKITGYRAGNAQAVWIDGNYDRIIGYIEKYIKKDMPLLYGKKRFWSSKQLNKPTTTRNGIFHYQLSSVIKNHTPDFINEYFEQQTHKKGLNIPLSCRNSDTLIDK